MESIVETVLRSMSSLKKPQAKFLCGLLLTLTAFRGKATFRNLSRYSEYDEKTYWRWYRRKFDFSEFNYQLLKSHLPAGHEKIAVIDASYMSKSGKKTEGLGWFYSGAAGEARYGLEISGIAIIDVQVNTGYALDVQQTVDADCDDGKDEDESLRSRVDLYAEQVQSQAKHVKALGVKYWAFDAYYTKVKFVDAVCQSGFHGIGKLRSDANLMYWYQGVHQGRGRPKIYDGKVDLTGDLDRFEQAAPRDDGTQVYSQVVYSKGLRRKIKVVVLRVQSGGKRIQAVLFSTDVTLSAEKIVTYYKARFQIEFVFRDGKQFTGLMDCQARGRQAIHTHVNASLTSLNLMKLEDARIQGHGDQKVISIASWKRKQFNQLFMKRVFDKLELDLSCNKIARVFQEFSEFGTIAA